MARFGPEVTDAPQVPSASTIKEGIETQPVTIQGANNVLNIFRQERAATRRTRQEEFLAEFSSTQLGIIQGVDQGTYNSSHGRTLLRKNLMEAVNNYPRLRESLIQANSSLLGQAGMGSVVMEEDREEQEIERARNTLIDNGLLAPGASDEDFVSAYNMWSNAEAADRAYQQENRRITLERAKIGLTSDQIDLLNAQERRASETYLSETGPLELQGFREFTNELINNNQLSESEKIIALENQWTQMLAEWGRWEGRVSSHFADSMRKSFEQHKSITESLLKGEIDQATAERQLQSIQTNIELKVFSNPTVAAAWATSRIYSSAELPLMQEVNNAVAEMFLLNGNGGNEVAQVFRDGGTGQQALNKYLEMVGDVDASPEVRAEQSTHLQNILLGVEDFQTTLARNPKAGNQLVNWFASQEFHSLLQSNPELNINAENALSVMRQHYADEVWGAVRKEFLDSNVVAVQGDLQQGPFANPMTEMQGTTGVEETPTPDAVTYRATSGGVEFLAINPTNREARQQANRLNRVLAPIINRVVKADAHLQQTTNYAEVFNQIAPTLFNSDGVAGGDVEDDLDIGGFKLGSALDEALTTGGFVGDGDYQEETTAIGVASRFIGFNETAHRNILSFFIEETTGGEINPETTAWCAAFVNAALGATGEQGTGQLTARSFLNWGRSVDVPQRGDIVVLERGDEPWMGHVGFYVREDKNYVYVLGGNQGNQVSIQRYNKNRLLGVRRGRYEL